MSSLGFIIEKGNISKRGGGETKKTKKINKIGKTKSQNNKTTINIDKFKKIEKKIN